MDLIIGSTKLNMPTILHRGEGKDADEWLKKGGATYMAEERLSSCKKRPRIKHASRRPKPPGCHRHVKGVQNNLGGEKRSERQFPLVQKDAP